MLHLSRFVKLVGLEYAKQRHKDLFLRFPVFNHKVSQQDKLWEFGSDVERRLVKNYLKCE